MVGFFFPQIDLITLGLLYFGELRRSHFILLAIKQNLR